MKASDGKYRLTDVCNIEEMFRIIESVPSKNAEPIKQWLAKLGNERIDETFDPSLTVQRAIDTYRAKGYDEEWIAKRTKGIQDRKQVGTTCLLFIRKLVIIDTIGYKEIKDVLCVKHITFKNIHCPICNIKKSCFFISYLFIIV